MRLSDLLWERIKWQVLCYWKILVFASFFEICIIALFGWMVETYVSKVFYSIILFWWISKLGRSLPHFWGSIHFISPDPTFVGIWWWCCSNSIITDFLHPCSLFFFTVLLCFPVSWCLKEWLSEILRLLICPSYCQRLITRFIIFL